MDEGFVRGTALIVLAPRPHHNRQDIVTQPIHVELLRDVVHTVGVLKGQVELVLRVEETEALVLLRPGALFRPALAVDVHADELGKVFGIVQAVVARLAVGDEPGYRGGSLVVCRVVFPLAGRVVFDWLLGQTAHVVVVVLPPLVWGDEGRVRPVGGRPVEQVLVVEDLFDEKCEVLD